MYTFIYTISIYLYKYFCINSPIYSLVLHTLIYTPFYMQFCIQIGAYILHICVYLTVYSSIVHAYTFVSTATVYILLKQFLYTVCLNSNLTLKRSSNYYWLITNVEIPSELYNHGSFTLAILNYIMFVNSELQSK